MNVTLMTDASFCPQTKAAGYGYWLASERGKLPGEGAFDVPIVTNIHAEMKVIHLGLLGGLGANLIYPGDRVLVQSDCLPAIERYDGTSTKLRPEEEELFQLMSKVREIPVDVWFRHVKAHTDNPNQRSRSNSVCDSKARYHMRQQRRRFEEMKHA